MKLPAYPRTKPSGVEWLGDVPEQWEVKRLDFLASVKARLGWKGLTASEYVPEGFIFLATPNIKGEGDIDFKNVNYITAERYYESPEIMVKVGDVLMAKDGSTLGTTNVVHHLPAPTTVNSSVAVLRPKPALNSSYFFRWITSAYLQSLIQSMKDGQGVPHLFQADIKKFPMLLPSPAEQRAIVAFLDRETGRVDRLVAKKRELIERLKEKRTALISRTVTRGLPPATARAAGLPENPPLKPSGLDWLGDIPAHWEVKRIKHLGSIRYGLGEPPEYVDDGLPFVRATDIKRGKINLDEVKKVRSEDIPWSRNPLLNLGEILVVRSGAYTGDSAIVSSSVAGCIAGYDMVLSVKRGHPAFVAWALLSKYLLQGQIYLERMRAAQPHLNAEELGGFVILAPPFPEQAAIAAYLDEETAKLDALVGKVEEAVERLQEYRTALITAAVTGKIDVRKSDLRIT